MKTKNVKKILAIIVILFLFIFDNYCIAFDYSKPYESNKNYCFSVEDTNSTEVNNLYFNDNVEIPHEFSLASRMNIPVANQGSLGLCDLFATLKSAETNFALKDGNFIDLSERYLDYMTSKYLYGIREPGVIGESEGDGSSWTEVGTFMETIGAPTEETVPYRNYTLDEINNLKNIDPVVRATGYIEFPDFYDLKNDEQREYWINALKKHIMKYGSLRVMVNCPDYGEDCFNGETNAMYFKKGVTAWSSRGGHGVSLVGWNDNYSKDNFNIKPQNNGAFLCLNSWSEDWGNNGYFWVSYEDDLIYSEISGFLGTKEAKKINEYTNAKKIFYNAGSEVNKNFIGIKFKRNSENEYFSHLTLDAIAQYMYGEDEAPVNSSIKTHFFLNPIDDSFDEDKMILLQTSEFQSHLNMGVILDNPIKIEGEKYSIVIQFEGDPNNISFHDNVDNDGNELPNVTYSSTGFGQEWSQSDFNMPIFAYTINKSISKVSLKNPPTKTTYIKGEQINLDGCKGTIEYDNGEIEEVNFTSQNSEISGFDPNKLGTQLVKLTYSGQTVEFNVVVKNEAKSINIKTKPTKLKYAKGETLDLTGGIITITYEDGTTEDINMNSTNVTTSGFDSSKLGEQEITVSYNNLTANFNVTITNELKSISVKENPTKTIFIKGEQLDFRGGIITATYEDDTTADINMNSTDVTYSNYDSDKIGKQSIVIKYKGQTTTLDVTIKNDLVSISVKKEPTKTIYAKGENLDISGGIITAKFEDNSITDIEMTSKNIVISGFNGNKVGEQKITITYQGKNTSFNVKVNEPTNPTTNPSEPNSNQNHTNSPSNDNTLSNTILPQTGTKIVIQFITLIAFALIFVISYILYKRNNY